MEQSLKQRGDGLSGTGNQMSNERLEKERRSCYESEPCAPFFLTAVLVVASALAAGLSPPPLGAAARHRGPARRGRRRTSALPVRDSHECARRATRCQRRADDLHRPYAGLAREADARPQAPPRHLPGPARHHLRPHVAGTDLRRGSHHSPIRRAARFANPRKLYLMYFSTYGDTCGLGNVGLKASVVWLSCTSQFPSGGTFSVLDAAQCHETLHALGAG